MNKRGILYIFLAALVLRLGAAAALTLRPPESLYGDHGPIVEGARSLAQGRGYRQDGRLTSFRAPGFSTLLAGAYLTFGDHAVTGRALQAFLGALVCLLVGILGMRLFGRSQGLIAGWICAVYPSAIFFSSCYNVENLGGLLFITVVICATELKRSGKRSWALGCGLAFGAGCLTIPVVALFLPVLCLWLVWKWKRSGQPARIGAMVLIFAGTVVFVAPWTVRNWLVHRAFVPFSTEGGIAFWIGNHPGARGDATDWVKGSPTSPLDGAYHVPGMTEVESNRYCFHQGCKFIREYPCRFMKLIPPKVYYLWTPVLRFQGIGKRVVMLVTYIPVIVLAIWGGVISWKRRSSSILLTLPPLYLTALFAVFGASQTRMRQSVMPMIIVLSGYGVWLAIEELSKHYARGK